MTTWATYKRRGRVQARPYVLGESLDGVSVSAEDREMGSPKAGDMVCRNRQNHRDQWLVNESVFEQNYEAET